MQANSLPKVDDDSAAHSARVEAHLRRTIAENDGAIGFAAYMHEILYAPGLGYYSAGATKFGHAGDFTTAPETSSLFGYVVARQCASILAEFEPSDSTAILELGAGSGKLAADILTRLAQLDALPDQYLILEVSADLQQRQAKFLEDTIPELFARVRWLGALPRQVNGVVIANEVLDALPVERFVRYEQHVAQQCVAATANGFEFVERDAPTALQDAVTAIENALQADLPVGYCSELCLAVPAWITDIAAALQRGAVLLFDYGVSRSEYYAPDRDDGWLRCHFRQHAHSNPLILPGIQDVTAWVDFSSVADAAVTAGLTVDAYVSQAHFLLNGGLTEELADFAELAPTAQMRLSAEVKLLTLPGEMGESFKCLGLSRGLKSQPPSLASMDRTFTL